HECFRTLAHGPVHGVALVEARAEDEEAVELAAEDGCSGVPAAGIAEDAERQRVVLRKHALCAQRGRGWQRPALGDSLEARLRRGAAISLRGAAAASCSTRARARMAMRLFAPA